jgi:transcription antitermination factor NusG
MEWLVVRINPLMAARALRQTGRLGHLAFHPRYLERGNERSLFGSYVFISSPGRWYHLLDMDSIVAIVCNRSDGTPFRSKALDASVELLLKQADDDGYVPRPKIVRKSRFLRGDRVRVLSGVFRDCCGEFNSFCDGRSRIQLDLLGASVTLDDSDIALIRAASGGRTQQQ